MYNPTNTSSAFMARPIPWQEWHHEHNIAYDPYYMNRVEYEECAIQRFFKEEQKKPPEQRSSY